MCECKEAKAKTLTTQTMLTALSMCTWLSQWSNKKLQETFQEYRNNILLDNFNATKLQDKLTKYLVKTLNIKFFAKIVKKNSSGGSQNSVLCVVWQTGKRCFPFHHWEIMSTVVESYLCNWQHHDQNSVHIKWTISENSKAKNAQMLQQIPSNSWRSLNC